MISTATIYIYFFDFEMRVASRAHHTASHDRQFAAGPFGKSTSNLYNTSLSTLTEPMIVHNDESIFFH